MIRFLLGCILWVSLVVSKAQMISIEMERFGVYKDGPPPIAEKAKTARYIAHNTEWTVLGTTSTIQDIKGRPFTNIFSFCDGPVDNSTGTPYFYVMDQDASMKDIVRGSMVSMTVSEGLTEYCKTQQYDPEDPRCARLTLTGKMVNMTGDERQFALSSLFSRHPAMKSWSVAHQFYPTKLEIDMIWLIDFFGGASLITVEDYYAAQP